MKRDSNKTTSQWPRTALDHLDALHGFAITLTHSVCEADDLVQETYISAAGHYEQLRPESNIKGWLFTIMRNTWLQQMRHAHSGPEFVAFDDGVSSRWLADSADGPEQSCIRIWEREEIRMAISRLPAACREIVVLRDIEEFSYKEISEILDCPLGTIMSRLARARAKLKRLLGDRQTAMLRSVAKD